MNVVDYVSSSGYPGRIIITGRDAAGTLFILYTLTGRSAASKRREFRPAVDRLEVVDTEGGPFDPLRHYAAAVSQRGLAVIGNGDHVVPLFSKISEGQDPYSAIGQIDAEPDPPIWTPRIGTVAFLGESPRAHLVVFGAARRPTDPPAGNRAVLTVNALEAGHAIGVKTYRGSVNDVVVDGVPVKMTLNGEWSDALTHLQQAIDPAVFIASVGTTLTQDGLAAPWSRH
ncbi:MAG: hypothetical protein JW722_01900 [Demequinaceae bacterium]|nr:hypothetical protein [Demequinaceae bacterium]